VTANGFTEEPEWAPETIMEKILIAAVLACQPGHRLIDWSNRMPAGTQLADVLVTVEPFYTRLFIYQPGHPEMAQRCCNGKPTSVMRVTVADGRFCIGQSQPQMKWTLRLTFKPGVAL
jgi:hypothetical protein